MSQNPDHRNPKVFNSLEADAFQKLEHAVLLKGFLKPFKGKGALKEWINICEHLRGQLILLGKENIAKQSHVYPLALLPIRLCHQTRGDGLIYFRWSNRNRSVINNKLWERLVQDQKTQIHLCEDLLAMEEQRIILNMQISILQIMIRQAMDCTEKMQHAQDIYQARIE